MLRSIQCFAVECAGGAQCAFAVAGQPAPLAGEFDAIHFSGPADPSVKAMLDEGLYPDCWVTDPEGRRWCPECVAAGKAPAGVWRDHPVAGAARALPVMCVLVECDGPSCRDLERGGRAVLSDDDGGPYHFAGPRDDTISSALLQGDWRVRDGRVWCKGCIGAGDAPLTGEDHLDAERSDYELVARYLAVQAALMEDPGREAPATGAVKVVASVVTVYCKCGDKATGQVVPGTRQPWQLRWLRDHTSERPGHGSCSPADAAEARDARASTYEIDDCAHCWQETIDGFECTGPCGVTLVAGAGKARGQWPPRRGMDWDRYVLVGPAMLERRQQQSERESPSVAGQP